MQAIRELALRTGMNELARPSIKCLPNEAYSELVILMDQLRKAYPHQDLAESLEMITRGYEILAAEHGIGRLTEALESLLVEPGRRFFPLPADAAEKLEEIRVAERTQFAKAAQRKRESREFSEFKLYVAERMSEGDSEEAILARYPSMAKAWREWKRTQEA